MAFDGKTTTDPGFTDMRAGLVVFGIIQIFMGAFCALAVFLVMLDILLSVKRQGPPVNLVTIVPSLLLNAGIAVWFIWAGIGSIRAQRWARTLTLLTSWIWLIVGVGSLAAYLMFPLDWLDQFARNAKVPQEMLPMFREIANGMMVIIYLFIPGALVLFYGNRNVRETCERNNSAECWTDRCPIPVLAVSIIFGITAISLLMKGLYGWVVPFFGMILDGYAGAGVCIGSAVLLCSIAWGVYRLDIRAWWCSVLMVIAWGASMVATFSRVSLLELYRKMNIPVEQQEMLKQFAVPMAHWFAFFVLVPVVVILGYLIYARRYFTSAAHKPGGLKDDPN